MSRLSQWTQAPPPASMDSIHSQQAELDSDKGHEAILHAVIVGPMVYALFRDGFNYSFPTSIALGLGVGWLTYKGYPAFLLRAFDKHILEQGFGGINYNYRPSVPHTEGAQVGPDTMQ